MGQGTLELKRHLKARAEAPFTVSMSAISNSLLSTQLEIAVARKQLDSVEQQGRNALTLIQSSAPSEVPAPANTANTPPGVGARLNVVA